MLYKSKCVHSVYLYLFVCFADLGLSAAVIIGIVLAVVVPLCSVGVCIFIIILVCRRRNINAAATSVPAGTAPPPYPGTDYPTQPQGGAPGAANPDEQKVDLQEYQADPAYPPPRNDQSASYPAANFIILAST